MTPPSAAPGPGEPPRPAATAHADSRGLNIRGPRGKPCNMQQCSPSPRIPARSAPRCGAVLLALLCSAACSSDERVVISEFVAANGNGLTDRDGDTSDWLELFNTTQSPVNLSGWCLTDDPRLPQRWCFPEISLPAQGYLVVFASGKRQPLSDKRELHANFKLKSTADYLGLIGSRGRSASEFSYPDQKQDVSFGLSRTGARGFLDKPTPGAANGEVTAGE